VGQVLPPVFSYWRDFGGRWITSLCTRPDIDKPVFESPPPPEDLHDWIVSVPPMPGAEYLTVEVLRSLWLETGQAFAVEWRASKLPIQEYLKSLHPAWNVVGRVHFNLAENRRDEESPFAFLATYTHRLSAHGKAQHLPLGQALRDYAGAANKGKLLSLLLPVQRAAASCAWLKQMVDDGEIFHPLRFSPDQALRFLKDVPQLESAGVVVRLPATWKAGRPSRPTITAVVGTKSPAAFGKNALLDFKMDITLDGSTLSPTEIQQILEKTSGLALIRGQWVEVDRDRLQRMLDRFTEAERVARDSGLGFTEAMRLLAGAGVAKNEIAADLDHDWSRVVAGPWLSETLLALRSPETMQRLHPGPELRGTLRPYQEVGVKWLHLLSQLGLGACLADDMGLGKTLQVLSLLLILRKNADAKPRPSLLVAPASLLANWAGEIERFTPGLKAFIAHTSAMSPAALKSPDPKLLSDSDLVITSYGSLLRIPWLLGSSWKLAVLDEAQAIKNPNAKQTRAVKSIQAKARIALTGTPVENRLSDLWSIFDFINPGLLGSGKEFTDYTKRLTNQAHNPFGPLRDLTRPYILRRLKTDRSVISDLPDKTEMKTYCQLSRQQAALYAESVNNLREQLDQSDGIKRRGVVLAFLMRFKQICNHPSQWLGDGSWAEDDSGKWARLRELCEVIAAKQEKVLVFTQFREVTAPLANFLGKMFGRSGLILHGQVDVKKRKDLVQKFQEDETVPFFVLSLKAGGSGLNLTAASHVIHFDRWWNPAVENQATDRAFRIGQKRNVLVHKFICRGTVEEKIDDLIESKKQLSRDLLEGGGELNLTELGNEELLALVALDLGAAMKE
jgi:non-specific serine/threonine protein kinase